MTCQYLARRISQHKYNVGREEKHIALAAHALDEGHTFDFENTKSLHLENNLWKRQILESMYIFVNKTVNFKRDFKYISYRNILLIDY